MYVSEGRVCDVQPLEVGQILADEQLPVKAGEAGVAHVEDLGVTVDGVGDGCVERTSTVHRDLAGPPETLAVVGTVSSTGGYHEGEEERWE